MTTNDNETLVDRWMRAIKNQRILAFIVVCGIVIGALASFTESVSKLAKFWHERQELISITGASQLKPDYSKHIRLWYPSLLHPQLRTKVEALRKLAAESNINLQYFETYRPPDVQHKMFGPPRTTAADAWSSPKQYGFAATLWLYERSGWANDPPEELAEQLALMATTVGLRQEGKSGVFVPWTYMLPSTDIAALKLGHYLPRVVGDDLWANNLNTQIESWGSRSPSAPPKVPER